MDLLSHVRRGLRTRALAHRGESLLLAVSGGLDSMVLLHVLHRLAGAWGWRLAVAHFNHRLRGNDSDLDEELVRRTSSTLGLPYVAGQGDVPACQREHSLSIEMAARKLRHEFLAGAARRLGMLKVALAHHADDQVELFFLRLLRGSGVDGLAGMDWLAVSPADPGIQLVRPFLDAPKTALEQFATKHRIAFRQDASNANTDILRNRLRHRLLPLLRSEYQPALTGIVRRIMDTLRAEGEYVELQILGDRRRDSVTSWKDLPLALRRRSVANQLRRLGVEPEFEWIDELCQTAPVTVCGPGGMLIEQNGMGEIQRKSSPEIPVFLPVLSLRLEGEHGRMEHAGKVIDWQIRDADAELLSAVEKKTLPKRTSPGRPPGNPPESGTEIFDAERVGNNITLRSWQPGDRFQPIGMNHAAKLQNLFVNLKIPRARRGQVTVATTGGEIFWVEGLRISHGYKLDKTSRKALIWSWRVCVQPGNEPVAGPRA